MPVTLSAKNKPGLHSPEETLYYKLAGSTQGEQDLQNYSSKRTAETQEDEPK